MGLEILLREAARRGLAARITTHCAILEAEPPGFVIAPSRYDLILAFCFLHRPLLVSPDPRRPPRNAAWNTYLAEVQAALRSRDHGSRSFDPSRRRAGSQSSRNAAGVTTGHRTP